MQSNNMSFPQTKITPKFPTSCDRALRLIGAGGMSVVGLNEETVESLISFRDAVVN